MCSGLNSVYPRGEISQTDPGNEYISFLDIPSIPVLRYDPGNSQERFQECWSINNFKKVTLPHQVRIPLQVRYPFGSGPDLKGYVRDGPRLNDGVYEGYVVTKCLLPAMKFLRLPPQNSIQNPLLCNKTPYVTSAFTAITFTLLKVTVRPPRSSAAQIVANSKNFLPQKDILKKPIINWKRRQIEIARDRRDNFFIISFYVQKKTRAAVRTIRSALPRQLTDLV